jgi:phage terminase large subunit-like protein
MTQRNSSSSMKFSREQQLAAARFQWSDIQARPEQLPPDGDWTCLLYLAGRGAGKTRMSAEWLAWESISKPKTRWAIIAPTMHSAISVCVEGESGLLSIFMRYGFSYDFLRSRAELILENESTIYLYSAEEPDRLRGPQFHGAWFDELAAFSKPDTYDLAIPSLRLGPNPQHLISTTPKPSPLIVNLAFSKNNRRIIRTGSTFDNAKNLAPNVILDLKELYGDSKFGRQELYGEILNQLDGALFSKEDIDNNRLKNPSRSLSFYQIIIGVDPAVTYSDESSLTGIIVVGQSQDGHCFILEDASMRAAPETWATKVVELTKKYPQARVVAEANNGGDLVVSVLRQVDRFIRVKKVTAATSKGSRAEPVSIAYSQGRIHHVGKFPELEEQMLYWIPGQSRKSPDRLDALVWAVCELIENESGAMAYLRRVSRYCTRCQMPVSKKYDVCPNCHSSLQESG